MSTEIVSGRVEKSVKERAAAYIRAAGLTAGEVIKQVWETIASTGDIPGSSREDAHSDADKAWDAFMDLRDGLTKESTSEDWLASLDDRRMREVVADMVEAKHA